MSCVAPATFAHSPPDPKRRQAAALQNHPNRSNSGLPLETVGDYLAAVARAHRLPGWERDRGADEADAAVADPDVDARRQGAQRRQPAGPAAVHVRLRIIDRPRAGERAVQELAQQPAVT